MSLEINIFDIVLELSPWYDMIHVALRDVLIHNVIPHYLTLRPQSVKLHYYVTLLNIGLLCYIIAFFEEETLTGRFRICVLKVLIMLLLYSG